MCPNHALSCPDNMPVDCQIPVQPLVDAITCSHPREDAAQDAASPQRARSGASIAKKPFNRHHRCNWNGEVPSMLRLPLILQYMNFAHHHRQLAVDLATRFNGEVINGDAMQMYHGLPIITNKIPPLEQKGVPHHLLGCIGLEEPPWRVDTFVRTALGIVRRPWHNMEY